jgi:hypothetical protein
MISEKLGRVLDSRLQINDFGDQTLTQSGEILNAAK